MDKNTQSALTLLNGHRVTLLDAARLIRNTLDSFSKESGLTPVQFCAKVISTGLRHIRNEEMSIKDGLLLYLETKRELRPDSLRDIRYLGSRLIKSNPKFGETYFSELKPALCEQYLSSAFKILQLLRRQANSTRRVRCYTVYLNLRSSANGAIKIP